MQTLSLITASYNRAHTIRDTIRSVNTQTFPHIDHIFIDGVSKDESVAIINAEAQRAPTVVSEPDKGFYDAYNKGLALAKGDIIGFINSDDFYVHDRVIERVMKVFEDPSVDAVHADLVYVKQDDPMKVVRHWHSRDLTPALMRRGFIPAHPTVFLRRSVYDRAGGFDLDYKLAADYEFLLRAFYTHAIKAVYLPEIWVRMRTGGATGGAMNDIKRQNDEIRKAQEKHDVVYPASKFFVHKVLNRIGQHVRGRFVTLPAPSFAR